MVRHGANSQRCHQRRAIVVKPKTSQTWAGQTPTLANGTPSNETGAAASRGTSSDIRGSAALSLRMSINSPSLSSSRLTSDGQRRQSSGVGEDRAAGLEPSSSSSRLTSDVGEDRAAESEPSSSSSRLIRQTSEKTVQRRRRRRRAAAASAKKSSSVGDGTEAGLVDGVG
ncbi:unnamed protein product [Brassica rapa subsp. narinosa]